MKSRWIYLLIFLGIVGSACAETRKHSKSYEQIEFSAEDSAVKQPVSIPGDVKEQLSRNEVVQTQLENENLPAENLPASWFLASKVHLSSTRRTDLIIVANSPVA